MMKGTLKTLFESGLPYAEASDLVPVRPISEEEENIRGIYREKLTALYTKLKG